MKILIGVAVTIIIVALGGTYASYETSPPPVSWIDDQLNSLNVGRIEATKTNGGPFMNAEADVYFRDASNHEAQSAFRWDYRYPVGGETPDLLRIQLLNARADAVRSEQMLRAFHAHGFRNVQLRYTSGQDVALEIPGLLMFDEDPHVNAARRRVANTIARRLVPPSSEYELVFLPKGRRVSDSPIFDLQDEINLVMNNPGETVSS